MFKTRRNVYFSAYAVRSFSHTLTHFFTLSSPFLPPLTPLSPHTHLSPTSVTPLLCHIISLCCSHFLRKFPTLLSRYAPSHPLKTPIQLLFEKPPLYPPYLDPPLHSICKGFFELFSDFSPIYIDK